jgi:hypothetical protein
MTPEELTKQGVKAHKTVADAGKDASAAVSGIMNPFHGTTTALVAGVVGVAVIAGVLAIVARS